MTVLANLTARNFNPQTRDFPLTVAADATQIVATLTHGDWPEGECIRAEVFWGGVSSGVFSTGGGVVRGKDGTPTGGTMITGRTCSKPPGITSGVARIEFMQTLNTAVLVESF